jgi:hypothetical protein
VIGGKNRGRRSRDLHVYHHGYRGHYRRHSIRTYRR